MLSALLVRLAAEVRRGLKLVVLIKGGYSMRVRLAAEVRRGLKQIFSDVASLTESVRLAAEGRRGLKRASQRKPMCISCRSPCR